MSYSDIEHYSTMITGCESITHGNHKSPDGRYALTVLQLHAGDAGLYAGQEGFLDHIKKGAKTLKKWFLEFLKAIGGFIDHLTGQNKRIKELEQEIERKKKEAKADKEQADALEEKLTVLFNSVFSEPQRLSEQVYEAIGVTGYLDSNAFEALNVSNMRIHSGYESIKQLIYASKHDAPDTKEISRELADMAKGINALAFMSKKEVSSWAEEDEQEAQKRDIAAASYLLKNYSKVLKWYTEALESYTSKAVEVKA